MGQVNPTTQCAKCGTQTEAPTFWRGNAFCSPKCLNAAIADRDKRVAEAAQAREESSEASEEETPKPKKSSSKKKAFPKEES